MKTGKPLPAVTLVLGGIRSGKSAHAEQLTTARGNGIYLATAEPRDAEMMRRIASHKERRGEIWTTVETPLDLVETLREMTREGAPVLVDCLTVWLSNLMEAGRDPEAETRCLIACLSDLSGPVVLVSNEVGLGGISSNPLARAFADSLGHLNQAAAMAADRVVLVTAGLPLVLKDVAQKD
ncbi:MAG: bifunctional adenosylcobinamide kinase/adenosylcobinamide-phosphate guanylyltransferase [Magnetospirillum sp. WYHS-4]